MFFETTTKGANKKLTSLVMNFYECISAEYKYKSNLKKIGMGWPHTFYGKTAIKL